VNYTSFGVILTYHPGPVKLHAEPERTQQYRYVYGLVCWGLAATIMIE